MKIISNHSNENILYIEYIDETRKKVKYKHADLQKWYDSEPTWIRPKTLFPMTTDTAIYIINNYHDYRPTRTEKIISNIAWVAVGLGVIVILYRIFELSTLIGNLI